MDHSLRLQLLVCVGAITANAAATTATLLLVLSCGCYYN